MSLDIFQHPVSHTKQFYGCNYYAILVLYLRVYCIIVRKYCKVKLYLFGYMTAGTV
jgi:hypothetical protein